MALINYQKVLDENIFLRDLGNINVVEDIDNKEEIFVFLSYDISDSTKLKSIYPHEWANAISILLNAQEEVQFMDFWKFNGDEVLFKCNISSIYFLCKLIERSYSQLESLQDAMQKHINSLTLKGTLWIALTNVGLNNYQNNYRFTVKGNIDFSGKNIDEGFRLTKCSSMKKLAIDPKIVYILLKRAFELEKESNRTDYSQEKRTLERAIKGILNRIHFIGDAFCKGVWDNNPYPIYWFYELDNPSGIRYGEFLNGIHLWRKELEPLYEYKDREFTLMTQMFQQVGIADEIENIDKKFQLFGEPNRTSAGKSNLYFMVVCINPTTGSVLIAQRSNLRKHLKGVWDFGNVKYQNIAMEEVIKSKYKSTFGIDIDILKDPNRAGSLKPFGYCTIYRNNMPHNGIMLYARIHADKPLNDEELAKQITEKINIGSLYQEIKFVSQDEIYNNKFTYDELTLDEICFDSQTAPKNTDYSRCKKGIMNFSASIKDAMDVWKKISKEGIKNG